MPIETPDELDEILIRSGASVEIPTTPSGVVIMPSERSAEEADARFLREGGLRITMISHDDLVREYGTIQDVSDFIFNAQWHRKRAKERTKPNGSI